MSRFFRALLGSLEFRLLVPLAITVAVVLSVHAVLSFRSIRNDFLDLAHSEVQRTSDLIQRATHDGMLLNRLDDVQTTIENIADAPEIAAIRVYDKKGTIVLTADRAEHSQQIDLQSETCRSCHGAAVTRDDALMEQRGLARVDGDAEVLRHLMVIENAPACAQAACHFHPADQRVLGVLDVELSMAPLQAAVAHSGRQLFWTTVALVIISGAVAAGYIRRVIHRPTLRLLAGTRRIAAGDLETHIEVRGQHELAQLATAFNGMVDELRTARQSITEWSHTLADRVAEKTEELQRVQRQVLHMEKMSSLGKLSATVAHELNNPLSSMLTYARLVKRELRDQSIDPEIRDELIRYLTVVDQECSRCGSIVHNLLTFARGSGSRVEPVDLNEIIQRALMLIQHRLELLSIRLQREVLVGESQIVADGGHLQQAFVALFVNAIEAMSDVEDRERVLAVSVTRLPDRGVEIRVSDTGIGIAPDDVAHIFEPFFSTKAETESGVGLGLAVVYGIINRHEGQIDVESEPGRGTTFIIRLPDEPKGESENEGELREAVANP